jgi:hypothetical protein
MASFSRRRFLVLTAMCAVLLPQLTTHAHAQQRQALQTRATAPAGAKPLGRMPGSQRLDLAISLPLRNQDQLNLLLQQLEDPTSPNYNHYLTVAQFTEQFGPTVEQYQQIIAFAQAHNLKVTHTSPNRTLLNVSGSAANVEQAFQVTMQIYQHPTENRTFYAPDIAPTVDAGLPVLSVSGLTNFARPHPLLKRAPAGVHSDQTGSGPGGQFYGSDIRTAYYSGPLAGSGQALALAELGQWNMADVQAYFTSVNQTLSVPIVTELLGGTSGACPGDCDDGEEVIDIQQIISMAPGASVLIVYEDTTGNADIDIFNAYATDNISKQMSFSFGIGDGNAAADENAFQEFHAQGQNFFVASGDEGANLGDGGWPGYSQNVTDVGGTDLTTASAGGAWASETGWAGSGTGWCDSSNSVTPCYQSPYDAIPSYQAPVITSQNGGSTKYRNLPDISAEANTDNFFCSSGTCQGGIGGTSLAAPRWAGFLALANEQAAANGETVGFLNPLVYTIGQGSGYDTAFHDITSGSNPSGTSVPSAFAGSFTAMTGFDMVTGWGTPNGSGMIDALAPTSTANPYFTLAASPSTLNLTPGGTPGTATISLTAGNGFTGSVTLAANALGSPGVTTSFNPASISGSGTSTLTVTPASGIPAGTLMLVVTGTSAGGIQTQPAFVTLDLPDFALSVTPSTIYLNQSSTASPTVTVNSQNGFSGTVNLSASALPTGVTGSFSPTSTTTTSTMTLTASATAETVSNDYLTVSGTSSGTSGTISPLNSPYTILSVSAATGTGGSGTPVDLSSAFNLPGIYADGITFGTGMDGAGFGYSSNLLTPNRILSGVQFNFGPANTTNCSTSPACTNDVVSAAGQVISLPAGQFTTLQLMATGIDGPVLSQTFTVTYSDNTTSTFTQNFSDWCSCSGSTPGPGQQPGESYAVVMPYRDGANGAPDQRVFNLYAYTFVLNSGKTVKSLTLPAQPKNGVVVVLAATLTTQSLGTQLSLSSQYNVAGIYTNGTTFPATGGMDGGGNGCTQSSGCADGYSAQQLGLSSTAPVLTLKQLQYAFGPVNTSNCTTACALDEININPGVTIPLPSNQQTSYTTLTMLGTGVQGSHTGTVTVNYTTGSAQTFNQKFSDWCNFGSNQYESIAVSGMSRINSDGTLNTIASCNLYAYTYSLDSTRVVQSIALANTDSTNFSIVAAITLSGNAAGTAGFTLSANPTTVSVPQGGTNTSTITVNPSNGFAGSVSLAASGLPGGVTASFSPTSATPTTSSVLTLTAASSAATGGPTTVTVTGTSGALTQTTTVGVTVTVSAPASYSLSAGAASPSSISPGGTSSATVTITPANSYTGTVNLTCGISPVVTPAASCSFGSTTPVTVTSSGGTATLTFSTVASSAMMSRKSTSLYALCLPLPGLALIGLRLGSRGGRTKKVLGLLLLWMILASLTVLPACGSGGKGGGGGTNPGTPAGTYTVTITGKDLNGVIESNTPPSIIVTVN